ncbi:hypothetical protein PV326_002266 [Microctonus aethiopoides]|nr:hypothetical protein PV326_002266 [Microctonus aethiopoides]
MVDDDLSVELINNYVASDVSFGSNDENSNPKLTSTPNKKKKKRNRITNDIQPGIDVLENDFENKNDIYDIHAARLL